MPKVGSFKIPNHDIETVVELIDEAYSRVNVQPGELDEETFQEEVLQRRGGSYSRYRYSLQQYGLVKRQHGADEVEITEPFVDIADPVPKEARKDAISEAVRNVQILEDMHEAGFEPGFSDRELRVWLIQEMGVPRDKANEEAVKTLRELYVPAHPYFDREKEEAAGEDGETKDEVMPDKPEADGAAGTGPPNAGAAPPPAGDDGEYEEFQIGDRYVRLPKEDLAEEWELLKATVDAYVQRLTANDSGTRD
jgi:hypothetical protein